MFVPPLNLISLPQPTDICSGYPFSVYPILCQLVCFSGGHFATLQNHDWKAPMGGHQLGGGNLRLLPLPLWPTTMTWAIVWALNGIMAAPGMP